MRFNVIALFPKAFDYHLTHSIIKSAAKKGLVSFNIVPLRPQLGFFGKLFSKPQKVDDEVYGGSGMLLKAQPILKQLKNLKKTHKILLSPEGKTLTQRKVIELSKIHKNITIVYGHYEGIDARVVESGYIDEIISLGEYVVTSGELPALTLIDAIVRVIPGVINQESLMNESFSKPDVFDEEYPLLDHPSYTRPKDFKVGGKVLSVPEILLSGDEAKIKEYKLEQRIQTTKEKRADLYKEYIKLTKPPAPKKKK